MESKINELQINLTKKKAKYMIFLKFFIVNFTNTTRLRKHKSKFELTWFTGLYRGILNVYRVETISDLILFFFICTGSNFFTCSVHDNEQLVLSGQLRNRENKISCSTHFAPVRYCFVFMVFDTIYKAILYIK